MTTGTPPMATPTAPQQAPPPPTGDTLVVDGAPAAEQSAPAMPDQYGDTGSGFFVGVEPAQPQQQGEIGREALESNGQQQLTPQVTPDQQSAPGSQQTFYTEEDLARARREEKEKLYPKMEEMSTALREMRDQQAAEQAAREQAEREAAEEAARAAESQMDPHELIAQKDAEWQRRFAELEEQNARAEALLAREREVAALDDYRRSVIDANADYIIPDLLDLIAHGPTTEAIDASAEDLKARTARIVQDAMAAVPQPPAPEPSPFAPVGPRGVSPTAPAVGPMEQQIGQRQFTAEDIAKMSMEEYRAHRSQFLNAANPTRPR